jgi:thymidylate synthase ThyX
MNRSEKELLGPFVTSTEKDIFVLRNLPEVVKGALFSRYSRSTKSLRQLLLDEFINNTDIELMQSDENELISIKKAQDFYDRVLDGFGDDSIGELGGAHVAMENISNLATKFIEDSRIGGSPLEKSSRYVWFNKKVNGEYQFYKEPKIMKSELKDLYLKTNNLLFDTYDKLIHPMTDFFIERCPKEEKTPDKAYKASRRAKAWGSLRGLLPASTLTNMGVFGNGRFFEYLIVKLRSQKLAEMNRMADDMQEELEKVIPSFVRRCRPNHRHFEPIKDFIVNLSEKTKELAEQLPEQPNNDQPIVTLVEYDKEAEEKLFSTLLFSNSNVSIKQIKEYIRNLSNKEKKKIIDDLFSKRTNRRHKPPRAFENVFYTFEILADFGIYRDIHRHRVLTQERQRLSTDHGYITPNEIKLAGFEKDWVRCMEEAHKAYNQIQK